MNIVTMNRVQSMSRRVLVFLGLVFLLVATGSTTTRQSVQYGSRVSDSRRRVRRGIVPRYEHHNDL